MVVQFIIQLILARILSPSDYGVIAIVIIFTAFSDIIIQGGIVTSIVRQKKITVGHINSAFILAFATSFVLYSLLFISSPFIAYFFKESSLKTALRIVGITLIFGAYTSVIIATLKRELNFKLIAVCSLLSVVISGIIAVFMALSGYGIFALIFQQTSYGIILTLSLFIATKWVPRLNFQIDLIRELLSFGISVLITNLVNEFFVQIRSITIGKQYTAADLAYYSKGQQFPSLVTSGLNGSLQEVLLPKFSLLQNSHSTLKDTLHLTSTVSTVVVWPILAILAVVSEDLICLLLTPKWIETAFFIKVFCIYYASWPLTSIFMNALYALGYSRKVMQVEFIRKTLDILTLILTMSFGPKIIAIGVSSVSLLSLFVYSKPTKKYLGISPLDELKEIWRVLVAVVTMCASILIIQSTIELLIFRLLVQVTVGIAIYTLSIKLLNPTIYNYIVAKIRDIVTHKRKSTF